ncbi:MAG: peptidylprolyl isomerase [Myxococcota bacterium]|jgi:cyclophilin family peptidyl-prolyl cis-trans isomerase/HEAT repeat protein
MRTFLVAAVAASSLTACATWTEPRKPAPGTPAPQRPTAQNSELLAIAELEDRRSFGDGRLPTQALTANDPAVRKRALLALGRIQDPAGADTLVKGLTDPDPGARGEAAFAIGLMGLSWEPLADDVKTKLSDALLAAESDEADATVKLAILEAMGRVVTPATQDRLVERLSAGGDVQSRAALSLGVAAKNGGKLEAKALTALLPLIKKEVGTATRYGAAYALMQSKSPGARPALMICATDDASEIRAICAKGLGEVGTDTDAVTLKNLLDDPDYRVAVEATRSLAKLAGKCKSTACPALGALSELSFRVERLVRGDTAGGAQPVLALAQAGLPAPGKALLVSLRQQLGAAATVSDQRVRRDAANLDCRLAAAIDRISGSLSEVMGCGQGLIEEPRRLALGLRELATLPAKDNNKRAAEVGSFVFHADPRVKLAAIELLGQTPSPASMEKVRTQLVSSDHVLAAAAAAAAAKLGDKAAVPQIRALAQKAVTQVDVAPVIADALATLDAKEAAGDLELWLGSTNATIRSAAAEALTRLKGQPVTANRVERPVDTVKPPPLPKDAALVFTTEKGEFEVKLYGEDAPLTATSIYTLARRGFYRGLTFHRVVPNFVVQGGDPRGDGEGGPGYTIRCEVNHRPYRRGVVGMALSGKDTGGSQFFVTAAPQPHLDGRYTAFGEVVSGQEVVDSLLEGDRIVEVRAKP